MMKNTESQEKEAGLLKAVLDSPFMQTKTTDEAYFIELNEYNENDGYCYKRKTDFKLDALSNFFEQDVANIFSVSAVWYRVHDEILKDLVELQSKVAKRRERGFELIQMNNPYPLDRVNEKICTARTIEGILNDLYEDLSVVYKKQLDDAWRDIPVEELKKVLSPKTVYAVVLDANEKLVGEPYPALITEKFPKVVVAAEIKQETFYSKTSQSVLVHFNPQVNGVSGHSHTIDKEAKSVILVTL
ncbi:MAG: hypothetical protein WC325_10820 [Candidatus Bathyarchaeia archaeon]|jgi:hypothetical protein